MAPHAVTQQRGNNWFRKALGDEYVKHCFLRVELHENCLRKQCAFVQAQGPALIAETGVSSRVAAVISWTLLTGSGQGCAATNVTG